MARTPLRSLAAVAAIALLTACGGGSEGAAPSSSSSDAAPATDAAPTGQSEAAAAPAQDGGAAVDVVNIAFKPGVIEVAVGDEVTWTSGDEAVKHTVTAGTPGADAIPGVSEAEEATKTGEFDGPLPDAGATFSHTFSKAGTYPYFCEVHPSMTGEVVVR